MNDIIKKLIACLSDMTVSKNLMFRKIWTFPFLILVVIFGILSVIRILKFQIDFLLLQFLLIELASSMLSLFLYKTFDLSIQNNFVNKFKGSNQSATSSVKSIVSALGIYKVAGMAFSAVTNKLQISELTMTSHYFSLTWNEDY